MASYIDSVLIKDEVVVHRAQLSIWALFPLIFVGLVLTPLFGVGLILILAAFIRYKTTELAITNKRVIAKFGFISRHTIELNLLKIESVQVNQSIIARMFNFGSLTLSGGGNPQAPIPGIADPLGFRKAFTEAQDQASK